MKYLALFAIVLVIVPENAQCNENQSSFDPQELLQHMSLPQKIAQLMVVAAVASEKDQRFIATQPYKLDQAYTKKVIEKYQIGSIVYLGRSTIEEQIETTKNFQTLSKKNPLLILFDAEWGIGMRFENGFRFPRNMTLGSIIDNNLIYQKGFIVGSQLREIGVHIILGPILDVNNNPANIVINSRSFGSDPKNVAEKGIAEMQGLHDAGIIACLKHFPGHGDTNIDSHQALPIILHDRTHLDAIELYPFKKAIEAGAQAIMTAHIKLPQIDPIYPATLSKKILTDLLRTEFGFNGLIIADGMGMKGITDHYEISEAAVLAVEAGVDMLLCPNVIEIGNTNESEDPIGAIITAIVGAVKANRLSEQDIDQKVMHVLEAKKRAFENKQPITHSIDMDQLRERMFRQALTLAKDTPIREPQIIRHFFDMSKSKEDQFGITKKELGYLQQAKLRDEYITAVLYGSPFAVEIMQDYADRIIVAYEVDQIMYKVVKEFLQGKGTAPGKLPV